MKNLHKILNKLSAHKSELFDQYSLKSLAIFGSFSRNTVHKDSDLDILVEFNAPIGIRFIDLADELEEMLGIKVDLVSKKGIKKKYLDAIEQDLIYV